MLHSVAIIAVAAIVTLIIRAVPFVAFDGKRGSGNSHISWKSTSAGHYGDSCYLLCKRN